MNELNDLLARLQDCVLKHEHDIEVSHSDASIAAYAEVIAETAASTTGRPSPTWVDDPVRGLVKHFVLYIARPLGFDAPWERRKYPYSYYVAGTDRREYPGALGDGWLDSYTAWVYEALGLL